MKTRALGCDTVTGFLLADVSEVGRFLLCRVKQSFELLNTEVEAV
jgi:hypothetical protein